MLPTLCSWEQAYGTRCRHALPPDGGERKAPQRVCGTIRLSRTRTRRPEGRDAQLGCEAEATLPPEVIPMARIYLSSTFRDLQAHRAAVYHQLRTMQHDVI